MLDNPLLSDVLAVLKAHPEGISEYGLLDELRDHPTLIAIKAESDLALFQKHFLLMNALYQLQQQLWECRGQVLQISPLKLRIETAPSASGQAVGELGSAALRDYYLNFDNFSETGAEDVANLLSSFWRDYHRHFSRDEALLTLDLPNEATKNEITLRYRELAAKHHPDRGGDANRFVEIRAAYESLMK